MKTLERLTFPSKRRWQARVAFDEAAAEANDKATRVELMEGANRRHEKELIAASINRSAKLMSHTEVLRRGDGSGAKVIYYCRANQEDVYLAPHSADEFEKARSVAEAAKTAHEKARAKWQKYQTETTDALAACRKAGTRYYRTTDSPGHYRGEPVPTVDILDLPEWKLRALIQGRIYGELPSEVLA